MSNEIILTISEEPDINLTIDSSITTFSELTDTPANYTGQAGKTVVVNGTEDGVEFSSAGAGDMTKAVYDPTTVNGDAFDMTNMVEGVTNKILTATDKSNLDLNTTHRSSDGKDHSDVVLNNTHRSSDGKDHSDVILNNTHRTSDGKDHSDVVLNNTHRTSDGKDHSDVVLNNTHRADVTTNPHFVTLEQARLISNILNGDVDFNDNNIVDIKGVGFQSGGELTWNPDFYTLNIPTTLGPILQPGQEEYIVFFNDTGVEIDNGKVLRPKAATLVGSEIIPTLELAKAGMDIYGMPLI